jgi:hypothetical protein
MMTTERAEALAEQAKEPEEKQKEGVLELTSEEITTIDLILTKERLAAAEEKLAAMQLRDSQAKLMDVGKRKAVLMAKLGARVGGRIASAKIVGQSRLAYELE